jgi:ATP phosphoribosyltransferase
MNLADTERIRFAIPTKGRLREPTIDLLQKSGYRFRVKDRNLYATCTNAEIVFIFVRADDIPVLVHNGVVDLGITGSDLVLERESEVEEVMKLGYGKCRLCVAVRDSFQGRDAASFQGKNIATSFPVMTGRYFSGQGVRVNAIEMKGSVEIMVNLGLADAIVDIVETGDSLRDNNLRVFSDIGSYETVLIANRSVAGDLRIQQIRRRIEGILVASQYSMLEYNIREHLLKEAETITPGYESPTVSRLDVENWLAIKVMVKKSDVVEVMDRLEALGATAIIESAINNCRL